MLATKETTNDRDCYSESPLSMVFVSGFSALSLQSNNLVIHSENILGLQFHLEIMTVLRNKRRNEDQSEG